MCVHRKLGGMVSSVAIVRPGGTEGQYSVREGGMYFFNLTRLFFPHPRVALGSFLLPDLLSLTVSPHRVWVLRFLKEWSGQASLLNSIPAESLALGWEE